MLPDSPTTAKFLSEHERKVVNQRIRENDTGLENKEWKLSQFVEALTDPKTWLILLFAAASNSPNRGLTTFQGLIIRGLGFSTLQTTLITMPSGGVQFVVYVVATSIASSFANARLAIMSVCLLPTLAGVLGMWLLPQDNGYGRLVCLWNTSTYTASWSLCMSVVVTANTAGQTKKATSAAMTLIGYCLGNFIGPFLFVTSQQPQYQLGVGMMLTCIVMQYLCIVGLYVLLLSRNRHRERDDATSIATPQDAADVGDRALGDETDLQKAPFRYVY